jgi:hypothetical protein
MAIPQLYFQPGGIADLIMQHCPELKLPFNPTMWAPDPHTQSAMGSECSAVHLSMQSRFFICCSRSRVSDALLIMFCAHTVDRLCCSMKLHVCPWACRA